MILTPGVKWGISIFSLVSPIRKLKSSFCFFIIWCVFSGSFSENFLVLFHRGKIQLFPDFSLFFLCILPTDHHLDVEKCGNHLGSYWPPLLLSFGIPTWKPALGRRSVRAHLRQQDLKGAVFHRCLQSSELCQSARGVLGCVHLCQRIDPAPLLLLLIPEKSDSDLLINKKQRLSLAWTSLLFCSS